METYLPYISPLIIAIIASGITYFATKRRIKLDATVEICRFREKWLEQLRTEVCDLNTLFVKAHHDLLSSEERQAFYRHMNKVMLLVSDTNPHWPELKKSMGEMFDRALGKKKMSENGDYEPFILVSKKILKAEWNEIQNMLYEKNK